MPSVVPPTVGGAPSAHSVCGLDAGMKGDFTPFLRLSFAASAAPGPSGPPSVGVSNNSHPYFPGCSPLPIFSFAAEAPDRLLLQAAALGPLRTSSTVAACGPCLHCIRSNLSAAGPLRTPALHPAVRWGRGRSPWIPVSYGSPGPSDNKAVPGSRFQGGGNRREMIRQNGDPDQEIGIPAVRCERCCFGRRTA